MFLLLLLLAFLLLEAGRSQRQGKGKTIPLR
jgi:hypothetical protein